MKSTVKQITVTISLIFCGSFFCYSQEKPKIKKENSAAVRKVEPVNAKVDKNVKAGEHFVIDEKSVKKMEYQKHIIKQAEEKKTPK
jgi:hypothetical protein